MNHSDNPSPDSNHVHKEDKNKKSLFPFIFILIIISLLAGGYFISKVYLAGWCIKTGEEKLHRGGFLEAEEYFKIARFINPNNGEAYNRLGNIYKKMGKWAEAEDYFLLAVQSSPHNPRFQYDLASIEIKRKKLEQGIKSLEKALSVDPDMHDARRLLFQSLIARRDYPYAEKTGIELIEKEPDNPENYVLLSDFYQKQKRTHDALKILEDSLSLKEPAPDSFIALLKLYRQANQKEKIEAMIPTMLEKFPHNIDIYRECADFYYIEKQPEKTLQIILSAKEKIPHEIKVYYYLYNLYVIKNDPKNAEATLIEMKDHFPDKPDGYFLLKDFYSSRREWDEALKVTMESLKLDPHNPRIYLNLGSIYYEKGDFINSEKELKRCLSLDGGTGLSHNMIAWLYITAHPQSGVYNPRKGLFHARKAFSLMPNNHAIIDTLARAFFANGFYEESAIYYHKNLVNQKNLPFTYYGLALNYYYLNQKDMSEKYLAEAISHQFSDPHLLIMDKDIPIIRDNAYFQNIIRAYPESL